MARRRSRHHNTSKSVVQRDVRTIARSHYSPLLKPNILIIPKVNQDLSEIYDRRLYHPNPVIRGRPNHMGDIAPIKAKIRSWSMPVSFQLPPNAIVCARRKIRKQVLFALRKTRKGASGRKHFNSDSLFKC